MTLLPYPFGPCLDYCNDQSCFGIDLGPSKILSGPLSAGPRGSWENSNPSNTFSPPAPLPTTLGFLFNPASVYVPWFPDPYRKIVTLKSLSSGESGILSFNPPSAGFTHSSLSCYSKSMYSSCLQTGSMV